MGLGSRSMSVVTRFDVQLVTNGDGCDFVLCVETPSKKGLDGALY
jgi:hypothetical protein